jgi:acetylornithine deacetylase/succinyl-diaminopimelate desuccinylase-like protein
MSRIQAIARAHRHFDDGGFFATLARRVAYHTESQVPESRSHLDAYLKDEIGPHLARLGYDMVTVANPARQGGPFLIAERREGDGLPTVLTYGHADVVRGQEGRWRENRDPWTLTKDGERWYGRGSADNKAQHSINLAALETVIAERGSLGFNSRILIETGEEIGSPGLHAICAQERGRLTADLLIGSDGPRLAPDRPTIFMGTRGAMNFDLDVDLRAGGHHSGNWGGLLANPGVILAHAIASLIDAGGRVLCRELVPQSIPNSIRVALADCEVKGGEDGPEIDAWWGEPGLTAPEKVFAWNTFEVLAMTTGNPLKPVNAVPPTASAHCQIRFTVDRPAAGFLPAIRRHLDAHGFPMVKIRAAEIEVMQATRVDPDHPAARWAAASIAATTGALPAVLPSLGGSLPNDCFAEILGMPTIWVPHSYAACSQHAPDEHVLEPLLREGLAIMTGLFWDMGEAPPARA